MSSSYDFLVDNIRFSYSSTSTFDNCAYSFKLTYIDALPRLNNFFSDYGNLTHECLEKYFTGELEVYELSQYYRDRYDEVVKCDSPVGLEARYKDQGQEFFDNFSIDRNNYEVLLTEDKIDFEIDGALIVAKPDLVLREKSTNLVYLFDYKTALPFREDKRTGKEITDTKKINGYYKQMFTYTYALRTIRGIPIDKITLLFTRANREVTIPWDLTQETEAVNWLLGVIKRVKSEEIFAYNNSNAFFCNHLCGVRNFCEYR